MSGMQLMKCGRCGQPMCVAWDAAWPGSVHFRVDGVFAVLMCSCLLLLFVCRNAPPGVSTVTCPGCRTTLQVPGRAAPPPTYAAPSNAYSSGAGGAGAGTAAAYYPGAAGPGAVASPPMRPPTPRELFMRIDTTRCGRINASQLSAALASSTLVHASTCARRRQKQLTCCQSRTWICVCVCVCLFFVCVL